MLRLIEECGKAMNTMIERGEQQSGPMSGVNELMEASRTMGEIAQHWMTNPAKLAEAQGDLLQDYTSTSGPTRRSA